MLILHELTMILIPMKFKVQVKTLNLDLKHIFEENPSEAADPLLRAVGPLG